MVVFCWVATLLLEDMLLKLVLCSVFLESFVFLSVLITTEFNFFWPLLNMLKKMLNLFLASSTYVGFMSSSCLVSMKVCCITSYKMKVWSEDSRCYVFSIKGKKKLILKTNLWSLIVNILEIFLANVQSYMLYVQNRNETDQFAYSFPFLTDAFHAFV